MNRVELNLTCLCWQVWAGFEDAESMNIVEEVWNMFEPDTHLTENLRKSIKELLSLTRWFTHKLRRTESYVGRPHSPATAATWGRYLFNPATSHTLYAAAPPIHTLCVTTNEDRKNFAQCFVSFAKGSSSQAVPPSWCFVIHMELK